MKLKIFSACKGLINTPINKKNPPLIELWLRSSSKVQTDSNVDHNINMDCNEETLKMERKNPHVAKLEQKTTT